MKQLKFMLAAATAIGLATAAQADGVKETRVVDNENFDTVENVEFARNMPGYSYSDPDNLADDESTISTAAEGYKGTQSLKVNTGTNALLRAMVASGDTAIPITLTAEKSVYIDTMVQFTVTPAGDTVTADEDDKLMIYLAEVTNETGVVTGTNLMVKAGKHVQTQSGRDYIDSFEPLDVAVSASGITVAPNVWYRLKVTSYVVGSITLFTATLNGVDLVAETQMYLLDTENKIFPSMVYGTDDSATLTYVGFAGEGMVDNLTVATLEPQTTVDFTLALGTGISAVQWTINGTEKNDGDTFSATAGTELDVVINSVTYLPGYAGTQNWIGWTTNTIESATVTVEAEQFGTVVNGVVTPNETVAAQVTNGSFAYGDATGEALVKAQEDLTEAITWATTKGGKGYSEAIDFINTLNVDDNVTTNDVNEAAYLFNCEPTAEKVKEAAEAFVFEAFDPTDPPTAEVFAGKGYNGEVVIEGATTLSDEKEGSNFGKPDWEENKQGAKFYRARLRK